MCDKKDCHLTKGKRRCLRDSKMGFLGDGGKRFGGGWLSVKVV